MNKRRVFKLSMFAIDIALTASVLLIVGLIEDALLLQILLFIPLFVVSVILSWIVQSYLEGFFNI